ncbi:MAG TPA: A24 family peptidase [Parachlamydiaceae bacterium]|nr:A24 family peptidase [Parachlamydiaceae bacterium]
MFSLKFLTATFIGAFVGKFMGMIIFYLPQILLEGCEKGREPRDILKWILEKPFCKSCKHPFLWMEATPLLGYFIVNGKCPRCGFSLKRYFLLELGIGLLFGLMISFPITPAMFFILLVTCLLMCCFFTDFDYSILPDQLTLTLVWVGLIGSLLPIFLSPQEAIIGAVGGYGIFWMINEIYRYFRGRDGMFPGDFKLNAGVGACIGVKLLFPVLAIALILLLGFSLIKLTYSKTLSTMDFLKQEVPYGCYLSLVAIGAVYLKFVGIIN